MGTINTYEEIRAWQDSIGFATEIYELTKGTPFSTDYDLSRQMRRAVISVSSNIAEGFERQTTKEFIQFLYIAKGSIGELRSQLLIAKNLGYIDRESYEELAEKGLTISKSLGKFISYLKGTVAKPTNSPTLKHSN